MPTKGKEIIVKAKRGKSPLLSRKVEIGQQTRSPISPTLERKHALEPRKLLIYEKPTISSTLYALNTIKHTFVDNNKLVPQSKVMSLRSMFNEKKVTTNSYVNNTTGSTTKTKDVRKPHIVHGKMLTRQPVVVDKTPKLFKDDLKNVTHEEDDKKIVLVNREDDDDILTGKVEEFEVPLCEPSAATCDESISSIDQHLDDDDHYNETNQQDQPDRISDHGSDDHQSRFEVDQINQEPEDEQQGPKPKEPDIKQGGEEVPNEEEPVIKNQKVVDHGKKDTAVYDYMMEVTLCELRQQRLNRVKALVGAFENVISLECNTLQKSIKQH